MSRPKGSQNKKKQPQILDAAESERLDYLAALLLEIVETEFHESEAA